MRDCRVSDRSAVNGVAQPCQAPTRCAMALSVILLANSAIASEPRTIALWLFDDPDYPAVTLTDAGEQQIDLRLREQGRLVSGRFGRALNPEPPSD